MKAAKGIVIVLLIALAAGGLAAGAAFAQGDEPPRPYFGRGGWAGPRVGPSLTDEDHPLHSYMMAALADALGISEVELADRLEGGETAMQIALAQGSTQEEAWTLVREANQAAGEAAAADGVALPIRTPESMPGSRLGPGGMLFEGDEHPLHAYLIAAYAEALGIPADELETRLEGGETMIDIALGTGIEGDALKTLMAEAHQAAVEAAEADGVELTGCMDVAAGMRPGWPAIRGRFDGRPFGPGRMQGFQPGATAP